MIYFIGGWLINHFKDGCSHVLRNRDISHKRINPFNMIYKLGYYNLVVDLSTELVEKDL